ncbi:MAG: GNAT family N-acetyltransferase [Thermoplasmata archaeon]|nr:GNAT family N-acetyltransferase [Thermoplasmata archaeon]
MTEVPVLEGFRLRLRAPHRPDMMVLFGWYNDPETVAPFDRFSIDSFEEFVAAVDGAPTDAHSLAPRFVVERKEDGKVLGFVGHYQAHPVLEITDVWYVLALPDERGKGYGTEAVGLLVDYLFHSQNLARVGATCDVENLPSARLLERLGFRREGTLRSALYHHAAWHDVLVFGVTRSEWADRPRQE